MVAFLLLGRLHDRPNPDQPGIQPLRHPLDHAALTRRIGSLKHEDQAFRTLLQQTLGMEQLELETA